MKQKLFSLWQHLPFFLACSLALSPFTYAQNLYEGEKLIEVNKVQTLFKFNKADNTKPLIIFIPSLGHLARISYGHPTGKETDFLSYWLNKKGYSFLGVSYPIDNPIFSQVYPHYSVRNWGNQIAALAKQLITQNQLSSHVVVLGWGMGGVVEESVSEALEKNHLTLDSFIGLAAMTPIYSANSLGTQVILPNLLLDNKEKFKFFFRLLQKQSEYNGHEIISEKIYRQEFLGNTPVALTATGYYLNKSKLDYNPQKSLEDTGVFYFSHTPWIGLVEDDSSSVIQHSLIDPDGWNFLRTQMLYQQVIHYINIDNVDKFNSVKRILNQIPQHFSESVHGNHFFFVGKKGARDTAQKVDLLIQKINTTKQNLVKLALKE